MKKTFLIITGLILMIGCNKTDSTISVDEMVERAAKEIKTITVEQLKTKIDSFEMFNLIDVREANEYNFGYIPGAVNIPRGILEFNIGKEEFWESTGYYFPEKTEEFVLYCKKGSRSILAAQSLMKIGYTNVVIIKGGWKKWELSYPNLQEKNLELESHGEKEEVGGC
jgi:rhodanese-related sulfurtransferase